MKWILVLYMTGRAGAIDHIEFPNERACLQAASSIWKHAQGSIGTVCVDTLGGAAK